jgi:hypothetical protein
VCHPFGTVPFSYPVILYPLMYILPSLSHSFPYPFLLISLSTCTEHPNYLVRCKMGDQLMEVTALSIKAMGITNSGQPRMFKDGYLASSPSNQVKNSYSSECQPSVLRISICNKSNAMSEVHIESTYLKCHRDLIHVLNRFIFVTIFVRMNNLMLDIILFKLPLTLL